MEQQKNLQSNNPVDKAHQLPLNQKPAFELVYYHGLTYGEAATLLKITVPELITTIRTTVENMKEKTVV